MGKELKIRTIYGESYDKFKSIANKETTYLDYDLNVYAKYIIEYIDNLEQQCKKQKEVIDKIKDLLIIKKSRCLNEDDYILNVLDLDEILDVLNEALECNK